MAGIPTVAGAKANFYDPGKFLRREDVVSDLKPSRQLKVGCIVFDRYFGPKNPEVIVERPTINYVLLSGCRNAKERGIPILALGWYEDEWSGEPLWTPEKLDADWPMLVEDIEEFSGCQRYRVMPPQARHI